MKRSKFVPQIVGIGGTLRPQSTSERAVAAALEVAEDLGAETLLFDGEFVSRLPHYDPSRIDRSKREQRFVEAIRQCHGVIVGTPGYHGSLAGPIKNALDFLEDTAQDRHPYLEGRAFGCVVTAHGWQACGTTLISLRMIAHALRAWPTPFGATLNASTPLFETNGTAISKAVHDQLAIVASQVVEFARWRQASSS